MAPARRKKTSPAQGKKSSPAQKSAHFQQAEEKSDSDEGEETRGVRGVLRLWH